MADLIVSIPSLPAEAGKHQVATDIQLEPGGGANFLIAGARLGQPTVALGALGNDEWGHRVAAILRDEDVDLTGVVYDGATTTVIVLVSRAGEHVFLGKYGHGDPLTLSPVQVELIKHSGAVYCAGYSLCETRLVEVTLVALQLAKDAGIPVYFDPGPQMASVPKQLRQQVVGLVDTVLATAEELSFLASSVEELMASGPQTVVVKQGPAGCVIYRTGQPPLELPGYPVSVVDTSAAGDSFNAAFITGSLWGWPSRDCAKLANAVGAAKVQNLGGGRNVPSLVQIEAVIAQFGVQFEVDFDHD